jgi:NitT/TauT family transport system substrate-binding protein
MRRTLLAATLAALTLAAAGCTAAAAPGAAGPDAAAPHAVASRPSAGPPLQLRLGFLASITQAPALIGARDGIFARDLRAAGATVRLIPFTSPAAETAALTAGALDAAYLDPAALLTAWQMTGRTGIAVISGATAGGGQLIVSHAITSPARLRGHAIAVPAITSPQDIALRTWLTRQHIPATGGTRGVTITTMTGPQAITALAAGTIAAAWEPPPYTTQMTLAGGRALPAAPTLGAASASACLAVTRAYLTAHPAAVTALLTGQIQANDYIHAHRATAATAATAELADVTGTTPLSPATAAAAFAKITFTDNPLIASIAADARQGAAFGILRPAGNLTTLYDLGPLNVLLRDAGQHPIT